jgi:hypothetical protein
MDVPPANRRTTEATFAPAPLLRNVRTKAARLDDVVSRECGSHPYRVAGESDRGRVSLAVVSVLATAAVGIAGAATTLLVSRDQRASERASRVYERRAPAYVDAIDTLERHVNVLDNLEWSKVTRVGGGWGFVWDDVKVDDEKDVARIRSRVVAFGTDEAIAALDRVGALDRKAFAWVFGEELPGEANREVWESKTSKAIDDLHNGLDEFELRLNRELTS